MKNNKYHCKKKHKSILDELACIPCTLSVCLQEFVGDTPKRKWNIVGIDGVSINDIQKRKETYLLDLSRQLQNLSPGGNPDKAYRHDRLRLQSIEKPNSKKKRIICVPTVTDRLVQRAIMLIFRRREFKVESKISYGGSRERRVTVAIENSKRLRKDRPWVLKTDISSFFDKIDRLKIKNIVSKKIPYRSLHPIIYQAIDAEIYPKISDEDKKTLDESEIEVGKGLRQGLPLSPLLSNLYLSSFDKSVEKSKFLAIRYVDDLAFFCKSKEECLEAKDFCINLLNPLKLHVPDIDFNKKSKTVIYSPSEAAEFLGLEIVRKSNGLYVLNISVSQYSKVHEKFKELSKIDENLANGRTFSKVTSIMESMMGSYKGHFGDANNYDHFEKCLEKWREWVYEELICKAFKIKDVSELDFNVKLFFNLITNIKLKEKNI